MMHLDDSWPICPLAAVGEDGGGVFVLIVYFIWRMEMKRTERFQLIAREIGLPFFPKGDAALLESLRHFHLFSQGRSRKITNMLHGESNDVELAVLDYRYTVGSGKNSHTYRQSVVYFRTPVPTLPKFAVRPEGFFHKIGGAFGYQDIDFESHPEFSRSYLLRGADEEAIRELFDEKRISFFESQKKICVEGGGDQLIFYRQRNRIDPEKVEELMQEGFQVLGLFRP